MICQNIVLLLLLAPWVAVVSGRRGGFHPTTFGSRGGLSPRIRTATTLSSSKLSSQTRHATSRDDNSDITAIQQCSVLSGVGASLVRGAGLRIASDLSGGTPLESVKCRVTATTEGPWEATKNIVKEDGILGLWSGTPSRTLEGALMGALFLLGSNAAKKQVVRMGGGRNMASLAGGCVGGLAQAIVMTPAGLIFTSLNVNRGKKGFENDNAFTVARRIIQEKGPFGLFYGMKPMSLRQATNWASRSWFTELARSTLKAPGLMGEIGSGIIGGIGSCWNTPIETIRVFMHADVSKGRPPKTIGEYWTDIVEDQGYTGLFRGVTPRAIQAVHQTIFMVVVPNILGY